MIKILTKNLLLITSLSCFSLFESFAQDSSRDVANPELANKIQGGLANLLLSSNHLTTLMFSEKESAKIEDALDSFRNDQTYVPEESDENKAAATSTETKEEINKKSYIYLASIMYLSDKYWAVWINGTKITSDHNNPNEEIYLSSVQRDKASVIWNISASKWKILLGKKSEGLESMINEKNQVVVKFELKPNQTYILGSNTIAEGVNVVAITQRKLEVKKVEAKAGALKNSTASEAVTIAAAPPPLSDNTATGIAAAKAKAAASGTKSSGTTIADSVSAAIAAATASTGAIVTTTGPAGAVTTGGTVTATTENKSN